MFLSELQPLVKEAIQQPVAFLGGFFSGVLRLNLSDDPLKSWLEKQGITTYVPEAGNGSSRGPQSISIE